MEIKRANIFYLCRNLISFAATTSSSSSSAAAAAAAAATTTNTKFARSSTFVRQRTVFPTITTTTTTKPFRTLFTSTLVPQPIQKPIGRATNTNTKLYFLSLLPTIPTTTLRNTRRMSATAVDHTDKRGAFTRKVSKHRHYISKTNPTFQPDANRYHLHIALACPWANGVLCMLHMKGLDNIISHSIVHPTWQRTNKEHENDLHCGWVYRHPGDEPLSNPLGYGSYPCDDVLQPDTITHVLSIRDLYHQCGDDTGPYTTPVLYDTVTKQIVSNESTEILRMLNFEFHDHVPPQKKDINLYPKDLVEELQHLNDTLIYPKVNNGVYRCGFAKSQDAYDEAVQELFYGLDTLDMKLSKQRYLGGNQFTFLDLRLFMTLVRFDPVYITYFKTNVKRLVDYPNLLGFVRDVYSMDDVRRVIHMDHIKIHYYTSHPSLNTYGIIPAYNGPDLNVPSGREKMGET